jgi:polygalacturonase
MTIKINWLCGITLIIICCLLTDNSCAQIIKTFNILDFGASPNGNKNSQKAIQETINQCAKVGGGTVLVPNGTFYTSTIYLKSNINFKLSEGATLIALAEKSLYKNEKQDIQDTGNDFIPALIVANNIENFSITGKGAIKGQPSFYYTTVTEKDSYPGWIENALKSGVSMQRPWVNDPKISLVYISDCENLYLEDISIIDSPNWSCHIQWSKNVKINGIKITSSLKNGVNSDGLDIDGCKNVIISNSIIQTGDDAICLKTTKQGARTESCEDIFIDNCTLSSTSCAIKIGTESHSDFKRIAFTNCQISNTNRGIGIIIRDGANVSDVKFSDITLDCKRKPFFWWGNGEAFHFNVLKRNPNSKVGTIKNISLKNISGTAEGTSSILGFDYNKDHQKSIQNISIRDINITLNKESELDKRASYALEINNATKIDIKDLSFSWDIFNRQDTWKNAIYFKDVDKLTMKNIFLQIEEKGNPHSAIFLNDVSNAYLELKTKQAIKLEAEGDKTKNIVVFQEEDKPLVILNSETKRKIRIIK